MKKLIYLPIYLSIYLSISLNGQSINSQVIDEKTSIQRNATYNLEELKVRWKKAALENCTGVPCVVAPPAPSFTCGTSTVSDVDGNIYNTVAIGTGTTAQCWTASNLKVTKYNDGTNILEINSTGTWDATIVTGARTVYNGLSANLSTYGYLYNWYAATDSRKICPTGWHVPTDGDWTSLIQFIDPTASATGTGAQSTTAGNVMKKNDASFWTTNIGTNTSGFSVLPSGYRNTDGSFSGIKENAYFWSATETNSNDAWARNLLGPSGRVGRYDFRKSDGYSVRCLRD